MSKLATILDLDAYFQRIGYKGDRSPTLKTLQAIQLLHPQTIPFENLNSFLKQPVPLELIPLQQKLIYEKRGGYCFEQNALLRSVLLVLGFRITSLAARVLWQVPHGTIPPRSHMLLQVAIDDQPYIVDVGFGGATLTAPLLLKPDIEQQTPHEVFFLTQMDSIYTLQICINQEWQSLYEFDLQEQYPSDYEVSNWYVSTHPRSLFVNSLLAARTGTNCRYGLRDNEFTTHYLNGTTEKRTLQSVSEMRSVLEETLQIQLPAIAQLDTALEQVIESSN